MEFDELVKCAQNRTNFHMQKRVHIHQLTKLLALSRDDSHYQSWNCIIVPHREICHLIRSQTASRTDCAGEFTALLLTRSRHQPSDHAFAMLRETIHWESARDPSNLLSAWMMKLIYIARGMDLLVKPIFRFDAETLQSTMNIPADQKIVAILLVGYPEETEISDGFPGYVRFHTNSFRPNSQQTIH